MLGKAGQIVCTLKIQNGYPSNGEVSVVEIHGADPAIIFQDSSVSNSACMYIVSTAALVRKVEVLGSH
jgi:hypothetical protein